MQQTEVIVIGGGPSGLMAAISAAEHGAKVLLIDKGDKLGRKLAISGGGRCNVTNNKPLDELIRHMPGNGRFLHSAFQHFNPDLIISFFERLGIALKEEDNGRMFPVSDKAKTVVDALIGEAVRLGVVLRANEPVEEVIYEDGAVRGVRLKSGSFLRADSVVIATGGKSVPHTGSTGDGYPWAEAAGHTITELYPTEVPLTSNTSFIRDRVLQGLSLRDIHIAVWNEKGKKVVEHAGDLIFTHFGLSGPAALRCSQFVVKERKRTGRETVQLTIDLKPEISANMLSQDALALWKQEPKKAVKNILKQIVPERMVALLLSMADIDESITFDHIPKQEWAHLCQLIKAFPLKASGTRSLEEAFVTGGGIHLKELDPKTMGSRLTSGLFFCGEILDIHGYTGGYNITAAFVTGYTAGMSAAK
ncbi:NAD(P)/FAD-dependent oxidoreductase [Paenibacillus sp. ACRRX]|uniref:NAD(P)/FAD-dependent oxidoreductase n=1 Tax=unclassified Paenibacillus TaxID=185978 RepID=UPI001EF3DB5B|nr:MULTISPECIES: NAD(P)/FAD-dependent oxidoreductase [unclassified Paenibacillus]MCG7408554.1 NAD(P)/FAD-dependent oxidoreductase [Paenibacillus sp. ACRRX]MDK8182802.1 NAD(P)/FAD-dependent oxidoreductase [Paenibacillus sp. UMB4589-SE434]